MLVILAHNRVGMTTDARTIRPPMVGVPALDKCDCGPSLLIDSPIWSAFSLRIMYGPTNKLMISAVMAAQADRKVIYLNRFSPDINSRSG